MLMEDFELLGPSPDDTARAMDDGGRTRGVKRYREAMADELHLSERRRAEHGDDVIGSEKRGKKRWRWR
jgi:hypothetical protein